MSNRSRGEHGIRMAPGKIPLSEKIRTVEMYLKLKSTNRVGEELGISGAAVRDRLFAVNVPLRPPGFSFDDLVWERRVAAVLAQLKEVQQ